MPATRTDADRSASTQTLPILHHPRGAPGCRLAKHRAAVLFRTADGTIIADEEFAIATGDTAFTAGHGVLAALTFRAEADKQDDGEECNAHDRFPGDGRNRLMIGRCWRFGICTGKAAKEKSQAIKNPPSRRVFRGLVGATGFEPATFSSRTRRATKLRYAPLCGAHSTEKLLAYKGLARNFLFSLHRGAGG